MSSPHHRPLRLVPGPQVTAFPAREDPRDALVWPGGTSLDSLPPGARIGHRVTPAGRPAARHRLPVQLHPRVGVCS